MTTKWNQITLKITLTDGIKYKLAKAYQDNCPYTVRLEHDQLNGTFLLLLTQRQLNVLLNDKQNEIDLQIKISWEQMRDQNQTEG